MFYLYEMQNGSPVYTGMTSEGKSGLAEHIQNAYGVNIVQPWIVETSFACGKFVLTTTPPDKMWKAD